MAVDRVHRRSNLRRGGRCLVGRGWGPRAGGHRSPGWAAVGQVTAYVPGSPTAHAVRAAGQLPPPRRAFDTVVDTVATSPPRFRVGDRVEVHYDPQPRPGDDLRGWAGGLSAGAHGGGGGLPAGQRVLRVDRRPVRGGRSLGTHTPVRATTGQRHSAWARRRARHGDAGRHGYRSGRQPRRRAPRSYPPGHHVPLTQAPSRPFRPPPV